MPRSPAGEGGRERPRACHSEPAVTAGGKGVGSAGTRESRIPKRERDRDGKREKRGGEIQGWRGEERDGTDLGLNPGVQAPSLGAQEEARARRRDADRERGRESPESEGAASILSRTIRSQMLRLDVHGWGDGGIPRSKLTWVSELLGPEDPGRKEGSQQGSDREPQRLSSSPPLPGPRGPRSPEKERGRERCSAGGKEGGEDPETEVWTWSLVLPALCRGRPGAPGHTEKERWRRRRGKPLPPLWVGKRPPPPPSPRHIPSLTATKKRRPRDPEGAPAPNPRGQQGAAGPPGMGGPRWGAPAKLPSARCVPLPREAGEGPGVGGGMEGRERRGHSRLERVLNGGGHGPLGWAASGPGRCCRRARAQPGLRRPLCRPARYDFIHSWGCGAS